MGLRRLRRGAGAGARRRAAHARLRGGLGRHRRRAHPRHQAARACRGAPSASTCATTSAYFVDAIGEIVEDGDRAAGCSPSASTAARSRSSTATSASATPSRAPRSCRRIRDVARAEGLILDPVYTGKAFYGMAQELARDTSALRPAHLLHPHRRHLRPVPQGEGARAASVIACCAHARRVRRRSRPRRCGPSRSTRYAQASRTVGSARVNLTRATTVLPIFLVAIAGVDARPPRRRRRRHARRAGSLSRCSAPYGFADNVFFAAARRVGITTALAIASIVSAVGGAGRRACWRGERFGLRARRAARCSCVGGVIALIALARRRPTASATRAHALDVTRRAGASLLAL